MLGDIDQVIRERTTLPFYAPFLPTLTSEKAVHLMKGGNASRIKSILGLPASRVGVPSPLKACCQCIRNDLQARPYSYWRTKHQWPATFVCLEHSSLLQFATEDFHKRGNFRLCLPNELPFHAWDSTEAPIDDFSLAVLTRVAEWTAAIVSLPASSFTSESLRHTYALGARNHGWLSLDGNLRLKPLRDSFATEHLALSSLPPLAFLSSIGGVGFGVLGSLLRKYPGVHHPSKHIFLMSFLFPDWDAFLAAHVRCLEATTENPNIELSSLRQCQLNEIQATVATGVSINAASRIAGVPTAPVVRHLKKKGVAYKARPRIVGTDREAQLIERLKCGVYKPDIAAELKVRLAFIKDYLALRPALKAEWETAYFKRERDLHRQQLIEVLRSNPGLPVKRIRRLPRNGFQWLYNHDRQWLLTQLPSLWRR